MNELHAPIVVDLADRRYPIYFRALHEVPGLMKEAGLRAGRCLVVTDANVGAQYGASLERSLNGAGWRSRTVTLPPGESTKSLPQLQAIYDVALSWGIDRQTPVLALGGGVVGDLAGFAAATLLRGVPIVQLPTSLIAQVDSAIGGKTGINHVVGKNLIGAFHQPALVCADVTTLATLPEREWTSGLAEVVKHALIADPDFVAFLEAHMPAVLHREAGVIEDLLYRAAAIKAEVVGEDEREQGRRAVLNFGHTFGHAIERVAGYGVFTHGEAVALGMRAALYLSGLKHPALPVERGNALIAQIPVEDTLADLAIEDLIQAMRSDKKARAQTLRFVLLRALGEAYVTADVTQEELVEAWMYAQRISA